jgi:hypothetical protein
VKAQESWYQGCGLNPEPSVHVTGVLTSQLQCSVTNDGFNYNMMCLIWIHEINTTSYYFTRLIVFIKRPFCVQTKVSLNDCESQYVIFTIAAMINAEIKRRTPLISNQKVVFCHSLLTCSTNLKYIKRNRCLASAVIIVVILFESINDPQRKKLIKFSL